MFAGQNSTQIFWPNTFGYYQSFITFFFHFQKHHRIHVGTKKLASIYAMKYVASCIQNAFANVIATKKNTRILNQVRKVSKLGCGTLHYHQTLKFFLLFSCFEMKNTTSGQRPEGTTGMQCTSNYDRATRRTKKTQWKANLGQIQK